VQKGERYLAEGIAFRNLLSFLVKGRRKGGIITDRRKRWSLLRERGKVERGFPSNNTTMILKWRGKGRGRNGCSSWQRGGGYSRGEIGKVRRIHERNTNIRGVGKSTGG